MSEADSSSENRGASTFRMVLDLVMGSVYLVLAGVVIYYKRFGTIELSGPVVYAMSGLLCLYGGFRIWLGITKYRGRQ